MSTDIARPGDVRIDLDKQVAYGYLARYRQPTRGLYEINLRQWFEWCAERGVRPLEAQRFHVEVWARELEELRGLKLSTVANKLNTVCGFYRFAEIDKVIDDNPTEYLRRPSVPKVSTRKGLTRSELLACLDFAQSCGKQEHALLCVLGLNGLRIGEVCALDVGDLGRVGGYRTIKVDREKGNRSGEIPMAPRTSWAIDALVGTRTEGPLFRKRWGERMDRKAANRIVQRIVKAAGITEKRITPHSFRHTHITLSLNAGVSIRDLQNGMGYADARQLSYYDRDRDSLARNQTHMLAAFVEGS